MGRLKAVAAILLAQVILVAFFGTMFRFQVLNEKRQLIMNSSVVVQFYSYQPNPYLTSYSRYFYNFGYPTVTSLFEDPMRPRQNRSMDEANFSRFSILLEDEIAKSSDSKIKEAFLHPPQNRIQEYGDTLAINALLTRDADRKPYGLVRISHNIKNLPRDVFFKNALLYFVVVFLYNSLIVLIFLYLSHRKRPLLVSLDRGYLHDHAIGALKLQHRILGDIIADHESMQPAAEPRSAAEPDDNVVPFEAPKKRN
jgi:hypothetical protein